VIERIWYHRLKTALCFAARPQGRLRKQSAHGILASNDVDGDEVITRFRELLVAVKQYVVVNFFPSRVEHANAARL